MGCPLAMIYKALKYKSQTETLKRHTGVFRHIFGTLKPFFFLKDKPRLFTTKIKSNLVLYPLVFIARRRALASEFMDRHPKINPFAPSNKINKALELEASGENYSGTALGCFHSRRKVALLIKRRVAGRLKFANEHFDWPTEKWGDILLLTKLCFQRNRDEVMKWPTQSPERNTIAYLWCEVKEAVADAHPTNNNQLWETAERAGKSILTERWENLVNSMQRRCVPVISNKGYASLLCSI